MMDFVRQGHERCDDIERASQAITGLQEDYGALKTRLAPFAASRDGIVSRVKELSAARDQLAQEIGSLEQTPQGLLTARVQKFTDEKKVLDDRLSSLDAEFAKLTTLRHDLTALFERFDRALNVSGARRRLKARSTSIPALRNSQPLLKERNPISTNRAPGRRVRPVEDQAQRVTIQARPAGSRQWRRCEPCRRTAADA